MQLRPYQTEAVKAIFDYWGRGGENPLVDMATGVGKSLVQANLFQKLLTQYPDMRVMSVTHVQELIEANYLELLNIWPWAPAGIYSAGLGRRESQAQILFAGIQTVYGRAREIGHVDVVSIDEAHLTPRSADTMYGRFLADLAAINPDLKVVGFTATPYRTDSGRLDEGDVRLFDKIVYTYGIADGIRDGYLCPLVSKATGVGFDLSGVHRRGGDYIPGELQAACDKDETTRAAVAEIIAMGSERKSWLNFCAGVQHAFHVRDEFRRRGISCEAVTGETSKRDRASALARFKSGELRALTNNSVLTTGFNHPGIDLLTMLRPTLSAGLYVQMVGRGTRITSGKSNCLVLDFAGNVWKHGPVDKVEPRKPGEGGGEAPIKECPNCQSLVPISIRYCPDCGYEFVPADKPKHEATAAVLPILSTNVPEWLPVEARHFGYHDKVGGTPSVRTTFDCGLKTYQNWICPQHSGFAKTKADRFWRDHGGTLPPPGNVNDFLKRQEELRDTASVQVRKAGRYWEVVGIKAGKTHTPTVRPKTTMMDDVIPF